MIDLSTAPSFMAGGGEMGALMRAHDWRGNELGDPGGWPQSLQTVVQIMLNTGHPLYVWWGGSGICLYNDAYRRSIGPEHHPGSLGRPAAQVWREIWPIIGPQIDQVMTGGGATWHENSLVPITRDGRREEVYWTYSYSPIGDRDAPNGIGGVLVICNETTQQVLAERRLGGIAKRQRDLFLAAPGFITILTGPHHVFEFVNTAYINLYGARDFIGQPVREAFPELDGQGYFELLDRVYSTGETVTSEAMPIRLQGAADTAPRDYSITFVYAPIVDENGAVTGVFCEGMDVTAQQVAEEHRRLLTGELQHRVKNMLAVVQAIVGQSLRGVATPVEARDAITSRLVTLAHAHDVLTQSSWTEAPLTALVEGAVMVHCHDRRRVHAAGPAVELRSRAALALSMALHELFTNAVKYGALSNDAGEITIDWSVSQGGQAERRFDLVWAERGGPAVARPTRSGFGTRLTGTGLIADLGAGGMTTYAAEGLRWSLSTRLAVICSTGVLS